MSRRNNSALLAAALILIAVVSITDVQGFTVTSTTTSSIAARTVTSTTTTSSCLHVLAPDNENGGMSMDEMRQAREEELEAMGGDPSFLTDDNLVEEEKEEKPDTDMDGTDMEFPSMSLMGAMNDGGEAASSVLSASGEEGDDAKKSEEISEKEEVKEPSKPKFEWDGTYDEGVYFDG